MKVIIIILQAILNLVRKRRDLIANRNKIPIDIKNAIKAIYNPCACPATTTTPTTAA